MAKPTPKNPKLSPQTSLKTVTNGSSEDHISVTITGPPEVVQRLLTAIRFPEDEMRLASARSAFHHTRWFSALSVDEGLWNPEVTLQIAKEMTFTTEVEGTDKLGGPKVRMISDSDRDAYRDRCLIVADHRGHPIADPTKIPNKVTTTVREVGSALFDFSS